MTLCVFVSRAQYRLNNESGGYVYLICLLFFFSSIVKNVMVENGWVFFST